MRLLKILLNFKTKDKNYITPTPVVLGRRLFAGENFKFGNPVRQLQRDLRAGYLCVDVYKHLRALQRAKYREYRHQRELWCHRMLKEVPISRQVRFPKSVSLSEDLRKPSYSSISLQTQITLKPPSDSDLDSLPLARDWEADFRELRLGLRRLLRLEW